MLKLFKQRVQRNGNTPMLDLPITAENIVDLFTNIDKYVEEIPEEERFNLHYSLCHRDDQGHFLWQEIIVFDIDNINKKVDYADYINTFLDCFNLSYGGTGIVHSGNGLHFIILLDEPIQEEEFFKEHRTEYKLVSKRLEKALKEKGLEGNVDNGLFRKLATLRLPGTKNIKVDKEDTEAKVVQRKLVPVSFSLKEQAKIIEIDKGESISKASLKQFLYLDAGSVVNGCEFIKYCRDNQESVSEQQWYAMIGILSFLPDSRNLIHQYSSQHPKYSQQETDLKIKYLKESGVGPRTCENIETLWDGCGDCKYFGKCKSPVTIMPEIKTSKTGFREIRVNKDGLKTPGKVCYEDLLKQFELDHEFVTFFESDDIYFYKDNYWNMKTKKHLRKYARDKIYPLASDTERKEFANLVMDTDSVEKDDWQISVQNKINLQNGVFDLDKQELVPHDKNYGFTYILDYSYDQDAKSPVFDKFMKDITKEHKPLEDLLLEFMGFTLFSPIYDPAKALLLVGDGANGKSTFIRIMQKVMGEKNYSSLSMSSLNNDQHRAMLLNKLANFSEETPSKSLLESDIFKNLTSGGETTVKLLFKDVIRMKNTAKMIFACNELPAASDPTTGFMRRLIIAPFNAVFLDRDADPFIESKMNEELPGILNRCVEAYKRFEKNKRIFTMPEMVKEAINNYMEDIDTVLAWRKERLEVRPYNKEDVPYDSHDFIYSTELYKDYKFYCDSMGRKPLSQKKVTKRLKTYINDDRFGKDHKLRRSCVFAVDLIQTEEY